MKRHLHLIAGRPVAEHEYAEAQRPIPVFTRACYPLSTYTSWLFVAAQATLLGAFMLVFICGFVVVVFSLA